PNPTQQAQPRRATMHTTTASPILLAKSPSTRFAPLCNKSLRSMALAGCISLAFLSPAIAADFSGSLKGVSITDAQATNKPPNASFTYTISSNTVTFNAGGTTDPDGTITKYQWDLGNGTKGEGITYSYQLVSNETNLKVTLTVIDNANAAALSQQAVSLVPVCSGTKGPFPSSPTKSDGTGNFLILTKIVLDCSATTQSIGAYLASSNTADRTVKYVIFSDSDNNPNEIVYNSASIQGGNGAYQNYPMAYNMTPGSYWIGVAENPKDQYWPQLKYSDGTYQYRLVKITQAEYDNLATGNKFSGFSNAPISGSNKNYGLTINF
ncbi:MAG: PKD domain-containing protein, partial [Chlorobium sp.]|nr:PKD domain-containing protein [Chlorobium sp.]